MMKVDHRIACSTHIGRSHQKNQDAAGAWTWRRSDGTPVSLAVVADGVSAGSHSERASRMAVEIVYRAVESLATDQAATLDVLLETVVSAAGRASRDIAVQARNGGDAADATTLVAGVALGTQAGGVWAGDSRVYFIRRDLVVPVTRDHSWAETVVSHGLMSADQAARDPRAHMITSWLGEQEPQAPTIEVFRLELSPEAVLLCCSDGLYAYVAPVPEATADLRALAVPRTDDLQSRLDDLITLALNRGGHDDLTGAAIQVLAAEDRTSSSLR